MKILHPSHYILKISFWAMAFSGISAGMHAQKPVSIDFGKIDISSLSSSNLKFEIRDQALYVHESKAGGAVWIKNVWFNKGIIHFEARGRDVFQKSFIGVAFNRSNDSTFECVYFRPFNFLATDTARKAHAVQYMFEPKHPWHQLRKLHYNKYERSIFPSVRPTDWFRVSIQVTDDSVKVFVNGSEDACMAVKRIAGPKGNAVGVWCGAGSNGEFRKLTIEEGATWATGNAQQGKAFRNEFPALRFTKIDQTPISRDYASTGGISWADFDGDEQEDVFITNGYDVSVAGSPPQVSRLYRNAKGVFSEVTNSPLTAALNYASGSTWGDMDNDGDLDVFVNTQQGRNDVFFLNKGKGNFIQDSSMEITSYKGSTFSSSWVDIDNDGYIDLYVSNGGLSRREVSFLFKNNGGKGFTKMATPMDIDTVAACGGVWADCDGDLDQDLFVPTMVGENLFYRNDGNWTFTKITKQTINDKGVLPFARSLTASWVDYDNDGDFDLFVGNANGYAPFLFINNKGVFEKAQGLSFLLESNYTFNHAWADFDNDGDQDLIMATWGGASIFYENMGSGKFTRTEKGDLGRFMSFASSLATCDYDNDGDLDFIIGHWPDSRGEQELNQFYRNDLDGSHDWLELKLTGSLSNRSAIGAKVLVHATINGKRTTQSRMISGQSSFRSQNSLVVHVGLGDAKTADMIEIFWPSGKKTVMENTAVNKLVHVNE
ncbi:MAG TPA: CRTAC1 family protein [Chitinophagaceae bacterium]|nr:CRTAC1 family protein [Chitinophagaceae bacterium]